MAVATLSQVSVVGVKSEKIRTISLAVISAGSNTKGLRDHFSLAHRSLSSAEPSGYDSDSDDSDTCVIAVSNIVSDDEVADTVAVREGARVHFPSVDVVSEVRYRPLTDPLERHCFYYTSIDFRLFKREYYDEIRTDRFTRARAIAAARPDQEKGSSSDTASPFSSLVRSAMILVTALSSGTMNVISRVELEHGLRQSRGLDGAQNSQCTNAWVDTLYLF